MKPHWCNWRCYPGYCIDPPAPPDVVYDAITGVEDARRLTMMRDVAVLVSALEQLANLWEDQAKSDRRGARDSWDQDEAAILDEQAELTLLHAAQLREQLGDRDPGPAWVGTDLETAAMILTSIGDRFGFTPGVARSLVTLLQTRLAADPGQ